MDGKDNVNSISKETNSPVELEQPSVFVSSTLDNTLLGGRGDENSNDSAAALSPADDKDEGIKGTGDHQFDSKDDQVSHISRLSNLDIGESEREVILESNEGESPPLTKDFKEGMMTDDPPSVDGAAADSRDTPMDEGLEVDASGSDTKSEEKSVSLNNKKRNESPSGDNGEIVCLNLENVTGNRDDGDQQHHLEPLDDTDKEEYVKVITGELCKAGHEDKVTLNPSEKDDKVVLKSSEIDTIDDTVSSTENIILQNSHILVPEESIASNAEEKCENSRSELPSSIVSADLSQAPSKDVIDTASDNIKSTHVTERFGNVSENGPGEIVTDESLKEVEKKQVTSNFVEHVEELDYEENDGDDGCGRPDKLKEDQENTQDGQSDKDEGELTDDDCEEGEIKEPGSKKMFVKPLCRFFQRGSCSWGPGCRFLHPGVNDKGNYQLIEMPGCAPVGIRSRLGVPGMWPEQLEEEAQLPPPPLPEVPLVETAWERGLRLAKERKKAAERKEKEPDFEEKRLNLSVDKQWELNKENECLPVVTSKDPYYDQPEYEEDEYYKVPREPWPTGQYPNSQVRYNQDRAYVSHQDKPPVAAAARYDPLYGPPEDKFDPERLGLREPIRLEAASVAPSYTPSLKRPDEWTDPWMRSKSPNNTKRKAHRTSRGKRKHRSASDNSHSSRSRSRSSGSSRSSRSYSSSSGSSSRSRSAGPAAPGLERRGHYLSPSRDQSSSGMPARGPGGYPGYYQSNRGNNRYQRGGYHVSNGSGGYYSNGGGGYYGNSYGGGGAGPAGGYPARNPRDRSPDRPWNTRGRSPPDRPLPYVRPRSKSGSSNSDSSRSRSRSRIRVSSSRSRSSSRSSRSSSSSSSSARSADSDHLYRDLGNPSKNVAPAPGKKSRGSNRTTNGPHLSAPPVSMPEFRLDQIPHPQDPKPPPPLPPSGKVEPKYASRNAPPPPPVKAKDPLKVVGQKSNIKLTLLPKSSLGSRPNPLDSPPHKRQLLDSDVSSPESSPPAKQPNLALEAAVLKRASEKAAKLQSKTAVKPLPVPVLQPTASSASSLPSGSQGKATTLAQRQPAGGVKLRTMEPAVAKTAPKAAVANIPTMTTPPKTTPTSTGTVKVKKTMISRREELLKQLKAVEDAIAKKKGKLP